MNINNLINEPEVKKRTFKYRSFKNDGLVLQVHHTISKDLKQQRIRFIHTSFNKKGQILAAADFTGNISLINFTENKFWVLPSINSCTALKFSNYNETEIVVGVTNGALYLINTETADVTAHWSGHDEPVTEISFSHDYMCLTSSRIEAIVWDLKTNSKLQVLSLSSSSLLKFVLFMPVTSNIIACFDDDTVAIWKHSTYELCKQILPSPWDKQILKSIAFTRNGRAMVFSGHSRQLTIFMLDTWAIAKSIVLPEYIHSVKKVDFIPQLFDGGANRVSVILSSNGIVYFYNIEQEQVIDKIVAGEEIIRFDCSADGKYIACVLRAGEINVYNASHYIPSDSKISLGKEDRQKSKSHNRLPLSTISKRNTRVLATVHKQLQEVLDLEKLRAILKEFGQYPDAYRNKIWAQLLCLPNNKHQYNNFINHLTQSSFESLAREYPLENKVALKNLRKLLNNLVTWCPHFVQVTYLPVLVFPFVKVFQNEPVLCFEAVCTIILNWCQYWFEYFPLPPVNILAMVENLLLEHDPELIQHFAIHNITSKLYAWSLMEAVFSEVLITSDWCKLWDHILTNEPAYFLMCTAAYNILHRQTLLAIDSLSEFEYFYHNQNVTDTKRLILKSYGLLHNTSEKNHPRLYLTSFTKLEVGSYPTFVGFPKIMIDFNTTELQNLNREKHILENETRLLLEQNEQRQRQIETMQKSEVENQRMKELELECKKRIAAESERVKEQHQRLLDLRRQLQEEEMDILNKSREKITERNNKQRQRTLEKILTDVEQSRQEEEVEVLKAEAELMKQYSNLLHHKIQLEDALNTEVPMPGPSHEYKKLRKQQQKLAEVVETIQKDSESVSHLKNLNIATGLAAMDDLIMRIELEMAEQTADQREDFNKTHSNIKVLKLEAETKQLELEVAKLLNLLGDLKSRETKGKIRSLRNTVSNKTDTLGSSSSIYKKQQKSRDFKDRVSTISSLGRNFGKLRKLVNTAHQGYIPGPSTTHNTGNFEHIRAQFT